MTEDTIEEEAKQGKTAAAETPAGALDTDPPEEEEDDDEDLFGDAEDDAQVEIGGKAPDPVAASLTEVEVKSAAASVDIERVHGGTKRAADVAIDKSTEGPKPTEAAIPRKSAKTPEKPSPSSKVPVSPTALGLPAAVKIPASISSSLLNGKLLDVLKSLPPNLINDALTEYDDAVDIKGNSIRNHGAYLYGVIKRYVSVHDRALSGEGSGILPMGEALTPTVLARLEDLVTSGFCTREEMNEKVKSKIRMLSERDALFALDELAGVDSKTIRNLGSYVIGILHRYMRGESSAGAGNNSANNRSSSVPSSRHHPHPPRGPDPQFSRSHDSSRPHPQFNPRDRPRDRPHDSFQKPLSHQQRHPMYDSRQPPQPWQSQRQQQPIPPPPPPQMQQQQMRPPPQQYMQPQQPPPPHMFPQQQQQQQQPPNSYVSQGFPGMQSQSLMPPGGPNSGVMGLNPYPPQQAPLAQGMVVPQQQFGSQQLSNPPFNPMMHHPQQSQGFTGPPQAFMGQPPQQQPMNMQPQGMQQSYNPAWPQQQQQPPPMALGGGGPVDIFGLADKAASAVQALANQNQMPTFPPQNQSLTQQSGGFLQPPQQQHPPQSQPSGFPPMGMPQQQQTQNFSSQGPPDMPWGQQQQSQQQRRRTFADVTDLPINVQMAVKNLQSTGAIDGPLDGGMIGMIHDLPESMALTALQKFATLNKSSMRNKTAYLAGLLRRELEKINRR